jgi:hypothetical protein
MAIIEQGIATNREMVENGCKVINQHMFYLIDLPYNINEADKCPTCAEILSKYSNVRVEDIYVEEPEVYNFALVPFEDIGIRPTTGVPFTIRNNNNTQPYYRFTGLKYVITYNNGVKSGVLNVAYPLLLTGYTSETGNFETKVFLDSGARIDFDTTDMKCYTADDANGTNSTEVSFFLSPRFWTNTDTPRLAPTITIGEAAEGDDTIPRTYITTKIVLESGYTYAPFPVYLKYTCNEGTFKLAAQTEGNFQNSGGTAYIYWAFSVEAGETVQWELESPITTSDGKPVICQAQKNPGELDRHITYNLVPEVYQGNIVLTDADRDIVSTLDYHLENL